jgi:nitrate/nitrite transporter NarK
MKLKSAFALCSAYVIAFGTLTGLSIYLEILETTAFFGACTTVFLILLPACSIKK